MMFCPNCGVQINGTARFCPNCGTAIAATVATTVNTALDGNYRVILVSRGLCTRMDAINLIEDLFAYSTRDAALIVDGAPMEVACALTAVQAQYISQAMTEYGMDVSVYNQNGYVNMGTRATQSVFDSSGALLSSVASVLLGLGAANRVSRYERWVQPTPVPALFRPQYRRAAPVPRRRYALRPTAPRPAPRPAPAGGVRRGPQTMPGRPAVPGVPHPGPGAVRPNAPAGRPDSGKPGGGRPGGGRPGGGRPGGIPGPR